jgi:hypothetical protein
MISPSSDSAGADSHRNGFRALGHHEVESSVVCVLTRISVRRRRDLLRMYRAYRRVARASRRTPGLLRTAFLVENARTWYSLSLWENSHAISQFGTNVPEHVQVVRSNFGRIGFSHSDGLDVWSTKWRLYSVSHNLRWEEFDLLPYVRQAKSTAAR